MNAPFVIACGILLPFLGTLIGTVLIVFFRHFLTPSKLSFLNALAAGVMTAAAVWSLLLPAISLSEKPFHWLPPLLGFLLGTFCILMLEHVLSNRRTNQTGMLYLAVTLHNFPEGMAVGIAMAVLSYTENLSLSAALILSLGIAIQNIPEGAIVYAPLLSGGMDSKKAFWLSVLSGAVEPAGALLTFTLTAFCTPLLPYFLSFAAGAMLYVVADEMIPSAKQSSSSLPSVIFIFGFALMMVLDVAFG